MTTWNSSFPCKVKGMPTHGLPNEINALDVNNAISCESPSAFPGVCQWVHPGLSLSAGACVQQYTGAPFSVNFLGNWTVVVSKSWYVQDLQHCHPKSWSNVSPDQIWACSRMEKGWKEAANLVQPCVAQIWSCSKIYLDWIVAPWSNVSPDQTKYGHAAKPTWIVAPCSWPLDPHSQQWSILCNWSRIIWTKYDMLLYIMICHWSLNNFYLSFPDNASPKAREQATEACLLLRLLNGPWHVPQC